MSAASSKDRPAWLDPTLYPFTPRRFATADGAISYLDEGRGPTVLMVHGTPSWSFEFREVVQALSGSHRVIVPDHLGFGLSDKPSGVPLRPEDHAQRLRALVEGLDLDELVLVVHDFGGPIGLPLALDASRRVRGVVVLNSWMWPSDGDPTIARIDRLVRSPLGRFLYRWLGISARVILPQSFGDRRRLTRALHRHYLAPLASRRAREGTYALACALRGSDGHYASLWQRREALASRPLALVWGERDPALTTSHRDRWLRAFPHARLIAAPDAGHFVAEERPDLVIAAIRDLLSQPRGTTTEGSTHAMPSLRE
jgi:haloalkane dehalogenase